MKQHITPKQAKEITEEQFYSLFDDIVRRKNWANYHHSKVTVGKLIELIGNSYEIRAIRVDHKRKKVYVVVKNNISSYTFEGDELCDILWGIIKRGLA